MSKLAVVGKPIPSIESTAKATGQTKYLQDIVFPGMLYGKILRSPYSHAVIKNIDISRARQLPGVRAVITAKDVPHQKHSVDMSYADKEVLCSKKVRFIGDEIAAVAADTLEIAQCAIELIDVEYEILPAVYDPEEAAKEGAPLIHEEKGSNIIYTIKNEFGNMEKGFSESDFIFEDEYHSPRQAQCCMETKGCIAMYEKGGKITVWAPTQGPNNLRGQLALALGIDKNRVRIINTPIGGAFGQKVVMDTHVPITVILSKIAQRPVKVINTREEELIAGRTGYEMKVRLRTGVARDGKILAKQVQVVMENGAYFDQGLSVMRFAGVVSSVLYDCPNTSYKGYLVYTNTEPCTAFRGFGNQQISYPFESQLDKIAKELGLDPMEIRMRNANKAGNTAACKAYINTCTFKECIIETAKLSDWEKKRQAYEAQDNKEKIRRGIGMAAMLHTGCSTRNSGFVASDAFIKMSEDGSVSVITPLAELGQGGTTVIAQIAAEGLGVKVEDVRVINDDTNFLPFDLGAFGSRQTFVNGHAVLAAAREAKKEMLSAAAHMLNCKAEELDAANGTVFFKNNPDASSMPTTREVAIHAVFNKGSLISGRGRFVDETAPQAGKTKAYSTYIPTYTFGCQTAEVEVDMETGKVKVLQVVSVNDSGCTINPQLAEGQMEGAIGQGLGYSLLEDYVVEQGEVKNPSFTDYKIMRPEDMPEMIIGFVESNDLGPFGLKGIGESGVVPTPGAVANAIYQATGLQIKSLPIKPEKIFNAMNKAE